MILRALLLMLACAGAGFAVGIAYAPHKLPAAAPLLGIVGLLMLCVGFAVGVAAATWEDA